MDISSLQNSGFTGASYSQEVTKGTMGKEDFLKLLVAQLSHQDPLQPMENTEFVAQLAQFSSLEQLMSVNSNLGLLQVAETAMTNSQVTYLIGKEVEAKGDHLQLSSSGSANVNFDLSTAAKDVTVKIKDAQGNTIRTLDAGSKKAGLTSVAWDGKDSIGNQMPAGTYSIEVSATDGSGNAVEASTMFRGTVTGISYQDGLPVLEIGSTTVQVGDVTAVRQKPDGDS